MNYISNYLNTMSSSLPTKAIPDTIPAMPDGFEASTQAAPAETVALPLKLAYIAGKVTGLPYPEVKAKFAASEAILVAQGYAVINPTKLVSETTPWPLAMRACIKGLMECDSIYLLPCHTESRGATVEFQLATILEMEIIAGL